MLRRHLLHSSIGSRAAPLFIIERTQRRLCSLEHQTTQRAQGLGEVAAGVASQGRQWLGSFNSLSVSRSTSAGPTLTTVDGLAEPTKNALMHKKNVKGGNEAHSINTSPRPIVVEAEDFVASMPQPRNVYGFPFPPHVETLLLEAIEDHLSCLDALSSASMSAEETISIMGSGDDNCSAMNTVGGVEDDATHQQLRKHAERQQLYDLPQLSSIWLTKPDAVALGLQFPEALKPVCFLVSFQSNSVSSSSPPMEERAHHQRCVSEPNQWKRQWFYNAAAFMTKKNLAKLQVPSDDAGSSTSSSSTDTDHHQVLLQQFERTILQRSLAKKRPIGLDGMHFAASVLEHYLSSQQIHSSWRSSQSDDGSHHCTCLNLWFTRKDLQRFIEATGGDNTNDENDVSVQEANRNMSSTALELLPDAKPVTFEPRSYSSSSPSPRGSAETKTSKNKSNPAHHFQRLELFHVSQVKDPTILTTMFNQLCGGSPQGSAGGTTNAQRTSPAAGHTHLNTIYLGRTSPSAHLVPFKPLTITGNYFRPDTEAAILQHVAATTDVANDGIAPPAVWLLRDELALLRAKLKLPSNDDIFDANKQFFSSMDPAVRGVCDVLTGMDPTSSEKNEESEAAENMSFPPFSVICKALAAHEVPLGIDGNMIVLPHCSSSDGQTDRQADLITHRSDALSTATRRLWRLDDATSSSSTDHSKKKKTLVVQPMLHFISNIWITAEELKENFPAHHKRLQRLIGRIGKRDTANSNNSKTTTTEKAGKKTGTSLNESLILSYLMLAKGARKVFTPSVPAGPSTASPPSLTAETTTEDEVYINLDALLGPEDVAMVPPHGQSIAAAAGGRGPLSHVSTRDAPFLQLHHNGNEFVHCAKELLQRPFYKSISRSGLDFDDDTNLPDHRHQVHHHLLSSQVSGGGGLGLSSLNLKPSPLGSALEGTLGIKRGGTAASTPFFAPQSSCFAPIGLFTNVVPRGQYGQVFPAPLATQMVEFLTLLQKPTAQNDLRRRMSPLFLSDKELRALVASGCHGAEIACGPTAPKLSPAAVTNVIVNERKQRAFFTAFYHISQLVDPAATIAWISKLHQASGSSAASPSPSVRLFLPGVAMSNHVRDLGLETILWGEAKTSDASFTERLSKEQQQVLLPGVCETGHESSCASRTTFLESLTPKIFDELNGRATNMALRLSASASAGNDDPVVGSAIEAGNDGPDAHCFTTRGIAEAFGAIMPPPPEFFANRKDDTAKASPKNGDAPPTSTPPSPSGFSDLMNVSPTLFARARVSTFEVLNSTAMKDRSSSSRFVKAVPFTALDVFSVSQCRYGTAPMLRFAMTYRPIDAATGQPYLNQEHIVTLTRLAWLLNSQLEDKDPSSTNSRKVSSVWAPRCVLELADLHPGTSFINVATTTGQVQRDNSSVAAKSFVGGVLFQNARGTKMPEIYALHNASETSNPELVEWMANTYTPMSGSGTPFNPRADWTWRMKAIAAREGYTSPVWIPRTEFVKAGIKFRQRRLDTGVESKLKAANHGAVRLKPVGVDDVFARTKSHKNWYFNIEEADDVDALKQYLETKASSRNLFLKKKKAKSGDPNRAEHQKKEKERKMRNDLKSVILSNEVVAPSSSANARKEVSNNNKRQWYDAATVRRRLYFAKRSAMMKETKQNQEAARAKDGDAVSVKWKEPKTAAAVHS